MKANFSLGQIPAGVFCHLKSTLSHFFCSFWHFLTLSTPFWVPRGTPNCHFYTAWYFSYLFTAPFLHFSTLRVPQITIFSCLGTFYVHPDANFYCFPSRFSLFTPPKVPGMQFSALPGTLCPNSLAFSTIRQPPEYLKHKFPLFQVLLPIGFHKL